MITIKEFYVALVIIVILSISAYTAVISYLTGPHFICTYMVDNDTALIRYELCVGRYKTLQEDGKL